MEDKKSNNNRWKDYLRALLIGVLVFIVVFIFQRRDVISTKYQQNDIKNKVSTFEFDKEDKREQIVDNEQEDPYLKNPINFDELSAINPQATMWLFVPNTSLNNYVLEENEFGYNHYLYRDIYGNKNDVGSFFVPKLKNDDNATINIYGHNFHDGINEVAFNSLGHIYENKENALKAKYAYIYTKKKTFKYELVMASDIMNTDVPYIDTGYQVNTDLYQEVLDHLKSHARFTMSEMKKDARGMMLTTCSAPTDYQPERLAVLFKLVEVRDN